MANIPNVPVFHTPNQSNPLVPFALAPGHLATDRQRHVVCPECPSTGNNNNTFHHGSMSLHFVRRHYALFMQYYGVPPPILFDCPFFPGGCLLGPFTRQSDLNDHLSEKHNLVPFAWRLVLNKQKRRHPDNLIADHVVEATALNVLIKRIVAAETSQPAPYASQHGLPLVLFEEDPARITDPRDTIAHKKEDLAPKLIYLRNIANSMGFLLGGGLGTWDQVATELEARAMSFVAPFAVPAAQSPAAEDDEVLEG